MSADAATDRFLQLLPYSDDSKWAVCAKNGTGPLATEFANTPQGVSQAVARWRESHDVWVGTNPIKPDVERGRGAAADVTHFVQLQCDLDVKPGSFTDLDDAKDCALALEAALGVPATVIVASGNGLQPRWLFDKPIEVTDANRVELSALARRFLDLVRVVASTPERPVAIDSTADLSRIMRVPGTYNRKDPDDVKPVLARYAPDDAPRLTPDILVDTLDKYVPTAPTPPPTPQEPRQRPTVAGLDREAQYVETAIQNEYNALARMLPNTGRNNQLNSGAFCLGQLVGMAGLTKDRVISEMWSAAQACGLVADDGVAACKASLLSGLEDGIAAGRPAHRIPDFDADTEIDLSWAEPGGDAEDPFRVKTPEEIAAESQERAEKAFEAAVAEEIRRIEAREEARRRVTAGDWVEPEAPIMWAEDIVALDIPPLQPRIDQLMFEDGTAVLVGERKVGKTSMLLHLARCLAEGEPVLGKYEVTVPDGSITILDYEMSLRQGRDWIEKISIETPRRVNGLYLRKMANPLATEAGRKWLTESLKRMETQVLLADPLAVMFSTLVEKEGDNSGLRRAFHMLEEICGDAGVREMVVAAHAGKDLEKGARGGSSIEDWPDTVMRLEKGTPEEGETEEPRHFMAMGRDVDIPWMQLTWDWDGRRIGVAHENMRPIKPKRGRAGRSDSDIKQEIFDYMKGTTQPASTNAIQGQVTGDDKRISAMIRELVDMGVLTSDPTWTKKTAAPWVMVEAAKKVNNPSEYEAG